MPLEPVSYSGRAGKRRASATALGHFLTGSSPSDLYADAAFAEVMWVINSRAAAGTFVATLTAAA